MRRAWAEIYSHCHSPLWADAAPPPMKLLTALLLPALAAGLSAAEPVNLVENGDFSKPAEAGQLPGWITTAPNWSVVEIRGAKVLRLVSKGESPSMVQQDIALPPGIMTAALSVKVKEGDVKGAHFEVFVELLNAAKEPVTPQVDPRTGAAGNSLFADVLEESPRFWRTITMIGKVPPGVAFVRILLLAGPGDGSVDFSNVRCEARR